MGEICNIKWKVPTILALMYDRGLEYYCSYSYIYINNYYVYPKTNGDIVYGEVI